MPTPVLYTLPKPTVCACNSDNYQQRDPTPPAAHTVATLFSKEELLADFKSVLRTRDRVSLGARIWQAE